MEEKWVDSGGDGTDSVRVMGRAPTYDSHRGCQYTALRASALNTVHSFTTTSYLKLVPRDFLRVLWFPPLLDGSANKIKLK